MALKFKLRHYPQIASARSQVQKRLAAHVPPTFRAPWPGLLHLVRRPAGAQMPRFLFGRTYLFWASIRPFGVILNCPGDGSSISSRFSSRLSAI